MNYKLDMLDIHVVIHVRDVVTVVLVLVPVILVKRSDVIVSIHAHGRGRKEMVHSSEVVGHLKN